MDRVEVKCCQLAHHQLMSQPRPHFSPHSTAKINKSTFLRRMVSSGISDVVITTVYSENTHLKNLMKMVIIISNTKTTY